MSTSLIKRITLNPEIAHAKPPIRNLCYTVKEMLEYVAGKDSMEDILTEFLNLTKKIFSPVCNRLCYNIK